MPLQPGARLGPYEVLSALGAGGMGEVWRARDSRLDRDVALKVLPEAFVADPERLARFQREAKVLASLNHPNIGGIHGVEESDGVNALVLELVEGPTLADRIARGPIPLEEALPIARQIAEALEAAHERGIIHRDLKPANIKVRSDGTVKVLDFGLAKALEPQLQPAVASADLSHSPTLTLGAATQMGVILGTAAYMPPEQARGRPVDKRADLWALGCVLYEMLTGRRAFGGDDVTDTLASVVRAEPNWRALPAETPLGVRRLLRRMLQKDPRERARDAGDARLELDEALANHGETGRDEASPAPPRRWWLRLPALAMLAALSLALAALAGRWLGRPAPQPAPMAQFAVPLPGEPLSSPAISPDGKNIAIVIGDGTHQAGLWLRPLGSLLWRELAGGVDSHYKDVVWSPDSAFVAFWKGQRLMKVSLDGAPEQEIAALGSSAFGGGAWSRDGTFILVEQDGLISRVAASGGAASPVLPMDAMPGSRTGSVPLLPQLLPDGERFLYYTRQADGTTVDAYLGSLNGSAARFLAGPPSSPTVQLYAEPGYLLYAQGRNLMAQRLDEEQLTPVGGPASLGLRVRGLSIWSLGASASADGTLVTASFDAESALAWVDRHGAELRRFEPTGPYWDLSLSPDGSWLTLNQGVDQQDLWRMDLDRGTLTPLTSSAETDWVTSWSPDGRRLAFTRGFDLYTMPADGSAAPTLLRQNDELTWAVDWSSNGRTLVCQRFSRATGTDVVVIDVEDPRSVTPVVESRFNEEQPRFSPDAEWIAYTSDASGRREVYVRPLGPGGAEPVSIRGGAYPQWRRDGRELYYTAPDRWLMAVDVDWSRTPPRIGQPQALFETRHPRRSGAGSDYVPSIDGQRFLVKVPAGPSSSPTLVVTLNWPALLEP